MGGRVPPIVRHQARLKDLLEEIVAISHDPTIARLARQGNRLLNELPEDDPPPNVVALPVRRIAA